MLGHHPNRKLMPQVDHYVNLITLSPKDSAVQQGTKTMTDRLYTVTELARDLGITARAIRFYEDKGLIKPQRAGNTRVYTHRDRGRLILILRGKRLGFSLREISEWLDLYDGDRDQVEQARVIASRVEDRIDQLEQQRRDIDATLIELREIREMAHAHLQTKGESTASNPSTPTGDGQPTQQTAKGDTRWTDKS